MARALGAAEVLQSFPAGTPILAVDLLMTEISEPIRLSRTRIRRAAVGGREAILDSRIGSEKGVFKRSTARIGA